VITVTGTEQVAAWGRRELPPVERLSGGIWTVPVPIPANPLRYTLSYLIPDGDHGLVIFDPGWNTDENWAALNRGLDQCGVSVAEVTGVVVSHVHPDHHGLSGRVREASGAWIAMHPAELENLAPAEATLTSMLQTPSPMVAALRRSGAPQEEVDVAEVRSGELVRDWPTIWRMAQPDLLLEDDALLPLKDRRLRVVWTPGHTPGHICLQEPDALLFLTGDHVLPRITPNIGLHGGAHQPILASFLASLDKVAGYDDHEVLPAHEYRFRGLRERVEQLKAHHAARLAELEGIVADAGEASVWQVAEQLTWSRPWSQVGEMRTAAVVETSAHITLLVDQGRLAWSAEDVEDADGVQRVKLAG
jgi:glyoxylase-like metal-dependent hydrolase (beta-lactamase superfamily II)